VAGGPFPVAGVDGSDQAAATGEREARAAATVLRLICMP
jgi:hypothetical protein